MDDTPAPDVLHVHINAFVDKWKDVQDCTGCNVFSSETVHAIDNLKERMTRGCLSNLLPGGGTNRNERLHHHINSLFNKSKRILLAYALLSVIIHAHNSVEKKNPDLYHNQLRQLH